MKTQLQFTLPDWLSARVATVGPLASDAARMQLTIDLARENVLRGSGGPFGATIFEQDSGRLVSVGVNRVVPENNCTLHAEMIAFMLAQQQLGRYTLNAPDLPAHTLYTSCSPCAMCLGASLWSGVTRIVIAARREDAGEIGFEEGPVFAASHAYLQQRGIVIEHDVLREDGRAVLRLYSEQGGLRYNGQSAD